MALETITTILCDGCGKRIKARAARHSRRRGVELSYPKLFIVEEPCGDDYESEQALTVRIDPMEYDLDGNKVACSPACVCKIVSQTIPKLKPIRDEDIKDED